MVLTAWNSSRGTYKSHGIQEENNVDYHIHICFCVWFFFSKSKQHVRVTTDQWTWGLSFATWISGFLVSIKKKKRNDQHRTDKGCDKDVCETQTNYIFGMRRRIIKVRKVESTGKQAGGKLINCLKLRMISFFQTNWMKLFQIMDIQNQSHRIY